MKAGASASSTKAVTSEPHRQLLHAEQHRRSIIANGERAAGALRGTDAARCSSAGSCRSARTDPTQRCRQGPWHGRHVCHDAGMRSLLLCLGLARVLRRHRSRTGGIDSRRQRAELSQATDGTRRPRSQLTPSIKASPHEWPERLAAIAPFGSRAESSADRRHRRADPGAIGSQACVAPARLASAAELRRVAFCAAAARRAARRWPAKPRWRSPSLAGRRARPDRRCWPALHRIRARRCRRARSGFGLQRCCATVSICRTQPPRFVGGGRARRHAGGSRRRGRTRPAAGKPRWALERYFVLRHAASAWATHDLVEELDTGRTLGRRLEAAGTAHRAARLAP